MKSILKFFTRLYPSAWYERYGAEFDALLEDSTPGLRDAFDVFLGALKMQMATWSFGRITLASCLAGTFVAIAISFAGPAHYKSQAVFTVTPASEARRDVIDAARDALSRESLASIIQKQNLYPGDREHMPLDKVIDRMRKGIYILPVSHNPTQIKDSSSFVLLFDYPDPHIAQQVNEELASRFLTASLTAAGLSQSHFRYVVRLEDDASFPSKSAWANRMRLATEGLLVGLVGGLVLAGIVRARNSALTTPPTSE